MDVAELTQQLVRIPSLNPMGRDEHEAPYLETRLTHFLEQYLSDLGLPVERQPVFPQRDNLLTRLEGRGQLADKLVLLEVHQDTVPVDGMTVPPFAAEIRDGRIYGRGTCDVKGGMAAVLSAALRLARQPAANQPTVVVAMSINEENGFDGISQLCQAWEGGTSELLPRAPDIAIVTEPTEFDVVVAHKGCVRWKCRTTGRAAHSSMPSAGVNAIYRMAPVIAELARYAESGLPVGRDHPLVGGPTLSVGMIHGGVSVNTVPDHCEIEIDRRLVPDEDPEAAVEHVLAYLAERGITDGVVHERPSIAAPGLSSDQNQALASALARACQRRGVGGRLRGVPFGTDAGPLSLADVPTVVFGPGSIDQAHTKDEWIATDALPPAVDILVDFVQHETPALFRP